VLGLMPFIGRQAKSDDECFLIYEISFVIVISDITLLFKYQRMLRYTAVIADFTLVSSHGFHSAGNKAMHRGSDKVPVGVFC
jgi:hypothetical protein